MLTFNDINNKYLSILLKSYWNLIAVAKHYAVKNLSILLKSYWNRIRRRKRRNNIRTFNSFKVLLELLIKYLYQWILGTFNSFKVLLERPDYTLGDMMEYPFNSFKVLLERYLTRYWRLQECRLSILLKSYWNCMLVSIFMMRIGSFNSFKVLLERVYDYLATPLQISFNSFKVLLELSISRVRAYLSSSFNSFKVLLEPTSTVANSHTWAILSILLKSYWNGIFNSNLYSLIPLTFNSFKVLLEQISKRCLYL